LFSFNYVYEMEGVHLGDLTKYFLHPPKGFCPLRI